MSTANECIPFYEAGDRISANAGSAITGKRFVKVGAARTGPELNTSTSGGNVNAVPCTAGARAFGVAAHDAATGEKVAVLGTGNVVPVKAGASITAGQQVESDGTGQAIPLSTGIAIGLALDDCASGSDAQIKLY